MLELKDPLTLLLIKDVQSNKKNKFRGYTKRKRKCWIFWLQLVYRNHQQNTLQNILSYKHKLDNLY